MKFRTLLVYVYSALLLWLSVEILLRRWILGQIPTPVPTLVVYVVLVLNGFVLWLLLRPRVAMARLRRTNKS